MIVSLNTNAPWLNPNPRLIVTTEFSLLELGNACARAEDHADFLALIAGMRASPRVKIIPLSSELLNAGWDNAYLLRLLGI